MKGLGEAKGRALRKELDEAGAEREGREEDEVVAGVVVVEPLNADLNSAVRSDGSDGCCESECGCARDGRGVESRGLGSDEES